MCLIQRFAVICRRTATTFITPTEFHFQKPIGIGQRLTCHAGDVSVTASQNLFGLFEGRDAARRNHRGCEAGSIYGALDLRDEWYSATKGTALVRQSRRHAFITALTRVGINGLAAFRLLAVFELAALRNRKIIKAGLREFPPEENPI